MFVISIGGTLGQLQKKTQFPLISRKSWGNVSYPISQDNPKMHNIAPRLTQYFILTWVPSRGKQARSLR